jgi:hypothetical protein
MTPRRIEWLIRIYGPAIASWPEEERRAALALLRRSTRLREALADALACEDTPADDEGDGAALARMRGGLDAAIAARTSQARVAAGARTTMRLGALAACAVLGVWIGSTQVSGQTLGDRDPLQVITNFSPASGLGALQP